jgi:hypothetical protein
MAVILNIAAVFSALVASWFWFASTRKPPPESYGYGLMAPEDWKTNPTDSFLWAVENSKKNKKAALASGVSALLIALSMIAELLT